MDMPNVLMIFNESWFEYQSVPHTKHTQNGFLSSKSAY